jgi:nucleoid-associated protein YgaU
MAELDGGGAPPSDSTGPVKKAEGALTRKLGPLPAWGWLLLVVGGAWAWYLWKKRTNGTTAVATVATPNTTSTSGVAAFDSGDATNNQDANAVPSVSQPDSETNAQWAIRAGNGIAAMGTYSAIDVSNALSVLLAGGTLTPTQAIIVNLAETTYGLPPEGVIATTTAAPPATPIVTSPTPVTVAPTAPAPAPAQRIYVVVSGDNLTRIAERFYGNSNWQQIYAANVGVIGGNPNLIFPGQRLVIP